MAGMDIESLSHLDFGREQTRTIKDPIHDYITFSSYIWGFIDTPQFQRLRSIKQLGISYYVWAGASHNRFEHCIGVAHLAGMLVSRLKHMQPELGITDRDVRCVQLAGLCHDLGHGPWSHVWDGQFIPAVLPGSRWTHEDASELMFDDLVKDNAIDIEQDDVNFIKDLIKGEPKHSLKKNPPEKRFLFDIVANKRNGLDVDKFDYLARDVRAVGSQCNFSARRLISSARVIRDEICYHIKDANAIYELYSLRFSNHKIIYSHKTARAIEYMLIDMLVNAESYMKIAEQIYDPKRYVHLTDSILEVIESSRAPELAESQRIIKRIRRRDLYRAVDWTIVKWPQRDLVKQITAERIVEAAKGLVHSSNRVTFDRELANELTASDVISDIACLHYGMKEKNPLTFVKFYGKYNIHEAMHAEQGELSTVVPEFHAEYCVRIYTKESRFHGLVYAGYREVLANIQREHNDFSIPELDASDSSTPPITEAPSTPKRTLSQLDSSANSNTPTRTNSEEKLTASQKTPFTTENKFTRVDPSYAPPSPTQSARRQGSSRRGMSTSSLKENLMNDGSGDFLLKVQKTESPGRALIPQDSLASIGGSTVCGRRTPEPGEGAQTDTEMEVDDKESESLSGLETPKRLVQNGILEPAAEVLTPYNTRLKRSEPPTKDSKVATPTKRRREQVAK